MDTEICTICFKHPGASRVYIGRDVIQACPKCREEYEIRKAYDELRPIIEQLFRHINGCRAWYSKKAFIQAISREHRTLQQCFTRFIVALIEYYASLDKGWYDLRNEATVHLCKALLPIVKEHPIPYI